MSLAAALSHPVCDCLYLAAAIREDGYVVTADGRFFEVVGRAVAYAGKVRMLEGG